MNDLDGPLKQLTRSARQKHYPKGQTIIYQEDKPQDIYVLLKGYVRVYDIDRQGNEKILHILRSGSLFPFVFFSGPEDDAYWFYAALTDCVVCAFSYEQMIEAVKADNQLLPFLVRCFALEVQEMLLRFSSLGKSSAEMKISAALRFLTLYSSKLHSDNWERVDFPVNHQLLADMAGLTRESAAMIMKDLAKKQLVRNPRQTILEINSTRLSLKP